jgi:UDP-N-acetyl-D-glucosamine dehydrogenase
MMRNQIRKRNVQNSTAGKRASKRTPHIVERDFGVRAQQYVVTVVGLGYVGLPLALSAHRSGYRVKGVDINRIYTHTLTHGEPPAFLEAEDSAYFTKHAPSIDFSSYVAERSNVFVICVPTPVHEDRTPDLGPVINAARIIAPHIGRKTLVVVESTVNPGVCEEVVLPILERDSGLVAEKDFYFAHCPERINPGDRDWTTNTIPRVLGTAGPRSDRAALHFYTSLIEAPVTLMSNIREAEAVKMVENSFRDINIAFVNELAMSFKKAGIDVMNVLKGASTKPFGFMPHYPGCGVGGHCIPVDPYYLIAYGYRNGFNHRFLEVARDINNRMPEYTVSLLEEKLAQFDVSMVGKKIALLGLSYKKDVPDLRESPAIMIASELQERGAMVETYDPLLPDHSTARSLSDALRGAIGAIIATNHTEFEHIEPTELRRHGVPILVDGRNCLDKEKFINAGIEYIGIGR